MRRKVMAAELGLGGAGVLLIVAAGVTSSPGLMFLLLLTAFTCVSASLVVHETWRAMCRTGRSAADLLGPRGRREPAGPR